MLVWKCGPNTQTLNPPGARPVGELPQPWLREFGFTCRIVGTRGCGGARHSGEGVARTEGLDAGRDSADLFVLLIQRGAASRVHLHHHRTHAADVLRPVSRSAGATSRSVTGWTGDGSRRSVTGWTVAADGRAAEVHRDRPADDGRAESPVITCLLPCECRGHAVGTLWARIRRSLSSHVMSFVQLERGLTPDQDRR